MVGYDPVTHKLQGEDEQPGDEPEHPDLLPQRLHVEMFVRFTVSELSYSHHCLWWVTLRGSAMFRLYCRNIDHYRHNCVLLSKVGSPASGPEKSAVRTVRKLGSVSIRVIICVVPISPHILGVNQL